MSTMVRKEITRLLRVWPQTLLPPIITMSLYFTIFGSLIGRHIGQIEGTPYMKFIAPGLIMMSVVTNAYQNGSFSVFSEKFHGSIEELIVAPIANWSIVVGFALGGVVRGVAVGTVVALIALFYTHLHVHHLSLLILTLILSAATFSLAGLLNGLYAKKFDDLAIVPTFVLTPLTYLGGVFFSISMLSPLWRHVALFNPILYIINTFRYSMLGISDINITVSLSILLATCITLFIICLSLLNRGHGARA